MEKFIYPAIFHKTENGGYWVEFPDLPGCLTEGDSLENAFLMAGDALDVYLADENTEKPIASKLSDIKVEEGDIAQMVQPMPYFTEDAKNYLVEDAIERGLNERNFTKNQAALILGVDRSYMTHIVSGRKTPAPDMAKRIGLLLNFDWKLFYANAQ